MILWSVTQAGLGCSVLLPHVASAEVTQGYFSWKVPDGFTHVSGTSARMAERLGPAGTVHQST